MLRIGKIATARNTCLGLETILSQNIRRIFQGDCNAQSAFAYLKLVYRDMCCSVRRNIIFLSIKLNPHQDGYPKKEIYNIWYVLVCHAVLLNYFCVQFFILT